MRENVEIAGVLAKEGVDPFLENAKGRRCRDLAMEKSSKKKEKKENSMLKKREDRPRLGPGPGTVKKIIFKIEKQFLRNRFHSPSPQGQSAKINVITKNNLRQQLPQSH